MAAADRIRQDMAALADPRKTDEAALERIVAATKPIYMLHGGLHSTETGSPEMLMELVYRLAVSEAPLIRQIRDRVLVLVNPVAEPDGRDRAVDWFYRHLKGKTDYENLPPKSPPYWGKYVFHDNNRDGIQRKLALTRATQDAFLRWHPVVVHDLHESIPLLSIWTGTGPYNVHLDPSLTSEWHAIAFHEVSALTAMGLPGVWTWGFGEGWGHFYADSVAVNHNAIGRGYETFGNATAETVERRLDPETEQIRGGRGDRPEWYRTSPPPKRFRWSLRNNVNYQQTGVLAALQYAALHGPDMMRNVWRRGANAVRKGTSEAPFAVAIRPRHDDPRRLERMIELLLAHGIEVARASAGFTVKEGTFPAGTYVVRMDQPYRGYALDLLTAQKFPADKTPYEPYDDVAWALPFALGVEVTRIADPSVRNVAATALTAAPRYRGHGERRRSDVPAEGRRAGGAPGRPRAPRGRRRAGGGEGLPLRRAWTTPRARGSCARRAARATRWPPPPRSSAWTSSPVRRRTWRGIRRTGRGWPCCRPGTTRSRRAGCAWPSTSGASPTR